MLLQMSSRRQPKRLSWWSSQPQGRSYLSALFSELWGRPTFCLREGRGEELMSWVGGVHHIVLFPGFALLIWMSYTVFLQHRNRKSKFTLGLIYILYLMLYKKCLIQNVVGQLSMTHYKDVCLCLAKNNDGDLIKMPFKSSHRLEVFWKCVNKNI